MAVLVLGAVASDGAMAGCDQNTPTFYVAKAPDFIRTPKPREPSEGVPPTIIWELARNITFGGNDIVIKKGARFYLYKDGTWSFVADFHNNTEKTASLDFYVAFEKDPYTPWPDLSAIKVVHEKDLQPQADWEKQAKNETIPGDDKKIFETLAADKQIQHVWKAQCRLR
jgi:hypothetical protein